MSGGLTYDDGDFYDQVEEQAARDPAIAARRRAYERERDGAAPASGYEAALREWQRNGAQGVPPSLAEWRAAQVGVLADDGLRLSPGLPAAPEALRPRRWIGGAGWLVPGALNIASGAPGSFKSTLMLHVAVALAAGEPWAGLRPDEPCRVLVAFYEDDLDEMWRRIWAATSCVAPHAFEAVARNLVLADLSAIGPLVCQVDMVGCQPTSALEMLRTAAAKHCAELVIIDPLAEAVAVLENDNAAMRAGLAPLRRMAQDQRAAVLLVHHDRKGAEGSPLDRMRGGSSIGGIIRRHLPVRPMTEKQAQAFDLQGDEADGFIALEKGKTQYARALGAAWFRVVTVNLPNGEDAAALEPWRPPSTTLADGHLSAALSAVREGVGGRPLTTSPNGRECRFADAFALKGVPKQLAKKTLDALQASGDVVPRAWKDPVRRAVAVRLWAEGTDLQGWQDAPHS